MLCVPIRGSTATLFLHQCSTDSGGEALKSKPTCDLEQKRMEALSLYDKHDKRCFISHVDFPSSRGANYVELANHNF